MEISDWINLSLSVASFLLALVSVITVVLTLRQNNKMIENSSRAYITVYGAITNFQNPLYYLILKNFGSSSAKITKFKPNFDLSLLVDKGKPTPFLHIVGTNIAPSQSFAASIIYKNLSKELKIISFEIEYISNNKTYNEVATINLEAYGELPIKRASTEGKESKIISYTIQDIAEKML